MPGFRIGAAFRARFSDDGTLLVTIGKRITLWEVEARRRIATGPPLSNASSVAIAPDQTVVAAKNTSGEIVVLGVPELDERARFSGRDVGEGAGIEFAPDSLHLVDASWSGRFTVRDVRSGNVRWEEPGDSVFQLARTRDRTVWAHDRSGHRWGRKGQVLIRRWPFPDHPSEVVPEIPGAQALALSDDGCKLAVRTRGIVVLERVSPDEPWAITSQLENVDYGGSGFRLAWSPDGALLAHTGDRRGEVYNAALHLLHTEPLPFPSDVEFSPDGSLLALGDWSAGISLAWPPLDGFHRGDGDPTDI